jgi:hypothetical protein
MADNTSARDLGEGFHQRKQSILKELLTGFDKSPKGNKLHFFLSGSPQDRDRL